jgi:hypothetical protein
LLPWADSVVVTRLNEKIWLSSLFDLEPYEFAEAVLRFHQAKYGSFLCIPITEGTGASIGDRRSHEYRPFFKHSCHDAYVIQFISHFILASGIFPK